MKHSFAGSEGAWPHSGRGGAVLPANLTVEHHGHDHPENLREDEIKVSVVAPPPFSSIMTAEAVREGRRRSGADQQDGDAEGDSQHQLQVVLHPFHALVDAVLQDRRHHTGQRGEGHTGGILTVVSPWSKPRRWSSPAAWPGSGTSQGWGPSRTDRSGDHNTSAGGEKKSVRAD